jgi:hypothetical protein
MGGVHECTPEDASIGFPMSAMPLYARRAMGVKALLHLLQGLHSDFGRPVLHCTFPRPSQPFAAQSQSGA